MTAPLVTLLSSMAPKDVLAEAASQYATLNLGTITTLCAGGVDVARRIEAGEAIDIVVLAQDSIDKLIAAGYASAEGRTDLMASGIAVAVRAGATHPAIRDEAAVKDAVLRAGSLSYSTGPSGRYLESLFERWGILATLRERIVVPPPGIPVASLIACGRVDLGFQQLSELISAPGIDLLGPLPDAIQLTTTFTAAFLGRSESGVRSKEFIRFLASPLTASIKQRHGMTTMGNT